MLWCTSDVTGITWKKLDPAFSGEPTDIAWSVFQTEVLPRACGICLGM